MKKEQSYEDIYGLGCEAGDFLYKKLKKQKKEIKRLKNEVEIAWEAIYDLLDMVRTINKAIGIETERRFDNED